MGRILVTGSVGQIGSELTLALRERYGNDNVVAGGRKTLPSEELRDSGPFEIVDCTEVEAVDHVVKTYEIDTVYHLAALLSAVAENEPQLAWKVNVNALVNVLEVAREQTVQSSPLVPLVHLDRQPCRQYATRHHPETHEHVRRHQSLRRATMRLLL